MHDKFADRVYRIIKDEVERKNLLEGFLPNKNDYREDKIINHFERPSQK